MAGYDGSHFITPDGWYQSQRDLITQAIRDRGNWYQLILKVYELDPEVRESGAKNTDYQNLKSADHLCDKTEDYAKNWTPAAERLWKEKRSRGRGSKFPQNIYCEKIPLGDIKKLQGIENGYRLRVGGLRILFSIENDTIFIENIIPGGQAYKRI